MHLVVIGAGEVGSNIAASLADTHDVVVIDVDPDRIESLTYSHDVLALRGDGTDLAVLEEAGAADAEMVIASTDNDETNLVACASAKILGDAFTVARVRNTTFLDSWHRSPRAFGVDFMVCSNLLTAEAIVRVAGLPAARDVDTFVDGRVQMAQFEVAADSPIANQTVSEADRFESLTFAAILDEEEVTIPTGATVIEAGTQIVVIGDPESVRAFSGTIAPGDRRATDVVVVGGSAIGEETARLLEQRGIGPTLIDHDEERSNQLAADLAHTVVLCHDATDVEFLIREHVDKADLAVVTLDSDERTLLVALLTKQIGTRRAVAVVDNGEYVDLFEAVGVDVAVNPREVTAEEITRFTHEGQAENVALIESDRAEVIEVEVDADSALAGRTVREGVAGFPPGVVIGAITRGDDMIAPRGDTTVEVGDHIIVLVDAAVVDAVLPKL